MNLTWNTIKQLDQPNWNALCAYLQTELLSSAKNEVALTGLRAELLTLVSRGTTHESRMIELLSSLAIFCRESEFVFAVTQQEEETLASLPAGKSVAGDLIVGCYRDSLQERLPTDDIERLSPITDAVSRLVQEMYQANPYPRWKNLPKITQDEEEKDILIAGCGSGLHTLISAAGSPRSRVVGIDLSLASLAYGLMKAREYGITNIRLVHGDLLDVAKIGRSFDQISAVGSVHHMDDPLQGVKALRDVLKPTGTLKLALYSKMGRRAALAGIALRRQLNVQPTEKGIRDFRQVIYQLPPNHPAKEITKVQDFYSISGCRDLLFHVREHNYMISDVFDLIDASGMHLAAFTLPGGMKEVELTREGLSRLEEEHPDFCGFMFRFVLARGDG